MLTSDNSHTGAFRTMSTSHLKDLPDLASCLQGIQLQLGCAQDPVSLEQTPVCVRGDRMVGPRHLPLPKPMHCLTSRAHPLWTTSNLMPLVWMALRKPRWLRLMHSLNCSLNSARGRKEGSSYSLRFFLQRVGLPAAHVSPGESVFLITLVLSF